jgi:hypothetical protein
MTFEESKEGDVPIANVSCNMTTTYFREERKYGIEILEVQVLAAK